LAFIEVPYLAAVLLEHAAVPNEPCTEVDKKLMINLLKSDAHSLSNPDLGWLARSWARLRRAC
jgi:hypothetical protein